MAVDRRGGTELRSSLILCRVLQLDDRWQNNLRMSMSLSAVTLHSNDREARECILPQHRLSEALIKISANTD